VKLFLDITRITYRLTGSTPTGIDRVEFAYARRTLAEPRRARDTVCVFTAPFFTGALRRERMMEILTRIGTAWRLDMPAERDDVYVALRDHLAAPVASAPIRRRFNDASRLQRLRRNMIYPVHDLIRSTTRLRRWVARPDADRAVYLNTSHNQLETPQRLAWADTRQTRRAFFIHDTIPIDYPEFVAPVSPGRHERRLATVAQMASHVIVNSQTTRRHIEAHLSRTRQNVPPISVLPLGVADAFMRLQRLGAPPARPGAHPYFVTLSTIEPRKNLLFLFAVWRRLVARHGAATPRLVVVGARGWENENIADILDRSRELGPYLVEVSDLCDDGLAHLIHGATGLLQPSSIEGFGLPLVEGLTVGVPVVASDIAAHREVADGFATFLDPIDGPSWMATVEALASAESGLAATVRAANRTYRPLTWNEHVDAALDQIAERRAA
jgi:glycosyltransferase involved in cell wall biosynthesis